MKKDNLEREIRFRVYDIRILRKTLRTLGWKRTERWKGRDILFDKGDELISGGRVLRLRLGMEKNDRGKLTYKNPNEELIFKVREEFETIVENSEMTIRILDNLGYLPIFQYEKRTELWKLWKNGFIDAEIYIDELPTIGCFIEIEGSKKDITRVTKSLGYDIKDGIKKSYKQYFEGMDRDKKEWVFEKNIKGEKR